MAFVKRLMGSGTVLDYPIPSGKKLISEEGRVFAVDINFVPPAEKKSVKRTRKKESKK